MDRGVEPSNQVCVDEGVEPSNQVYVDGVYNLVTRCMWMGCRA